MQTLRDITNYIKAWRLQSTNMRQEDVGVKADLSKQHYQRIESGSDLKLTTLLAVLDVLGLEIRLMPKSKRIKDAREIDQLVAEAKNKLASSTDNAPLQVNASNSDNIELTTKQQRTRAVFGSRLAKRQKQST